MIRSLSWLLYPFMLIYALIINTRNRLFDLGIFKPVEFDIPVISVGNITVGGTGKTPHVEYLISLLSPQFLLAVLSRGYKRKSRGFVLGNENSTALDLGDEPLQIKKKFPDALVAVDGNRVRGIQKLLELNPALSLVILDDAFQHRWVQPGLSILLVDYSRLLSEDTLLPVGRLREPAYEQRRAQIIVVTKCSHELKPIERRITIQKLGALPYQMVVFSRLQYGNLVPVFSDSGKAFRVEDLRNQKGSILLITGIANPKLLYQELEKYSDTINHLSFPDHHAFTTRDILRMIKSFDSMGGSKKYIITTEKDAVRLRMYQQLDEDIKQRMYYLPIQVKFHESDEEVFRKMILNHVGNYSRNRSISKKIHRNPAGYSDHSGDRP